MDDALNVSSYESEGTMYGDRTNTCMFKMFTFPGCGPMETTNGARCFLGQRFSLDCVRVYCDSTNYNLSLFDKSNMTGITKLYGQNNINQWYGLLGYIGFCNSFINRDNPITPYLYVQVQNLDTVPTGTIFIEFVTSGT